MKIYQNNGWNANINNTWNTGYLNHIKTNIKNESNNILNYILFKFISKNNMNYKIINSITNIIEIIKYIICSINNGGFDMNQIDSISNVISICILTIIMIDIHFILNIIIFIVENNFPKLCYEYKGKLLKFRMNIETNNFRNKLCVIIKIFKNLFEREKFLIS